MATVDYRNMSGYIGTYQGTNVYMVKEVNYNHAANIEAKDILALSFGGSREIRLMREGKWIGTMDPEGHVTIFPKPKKYERRAPVNYSQRVNLDDYTTKEVQLSKDLVELRQDRSKEFVAASAAESQQMIDDFLYRRQSVVDKFLEDIKKNNLSASGKK